MKDISGKLFADKLYEVTEDYVWECKPLICKFKKGDTVKFEPSFAGNIRVLKQNPDEDGTYRHRLAIMKIKDVKQLLKPKQLQTTLD